MFSPDVEQETWGRWGRWQLERVRALRRRRTLSFVKYTCAQSCLTFCSPMDCSPPGPLSVGFSRQKYWSGLLFQNPPRDLTDPGIEAASSESLALQADSLAFEPLGSQFRFVRGQLNASVGSLDVQKQPDNQEFRWKVISLRVWEEAQCIQARTLRWMILRRGFQSSQTTNFARSWVLHP